MGYLPFFVELTGTQGLVVGGGAVALRKVPKLMPYGPALTVVAPEFCGALRETSGVTLLERPFAPEDLAYRDFVIAATDDHGLNLRIAELCRTRRLPVNVVDCKEACTFLFPALVKRGGLSVGISTSGAGPTAAVYLKERFAELLPERFEEILTFLESVRETAKVQLPEPGRKRLLTEVFSACMEAGRPLTDAELAEALCRAREEDDDARA